jgi:hypothetical protein
MRRATEIMYSAVHVGCQGCSMLKNRGLSKSFISSMKDTKTRKISRYDYLAGQIVTCKKEQLRIYFFVDNTKQT